MKSNTTRLLKEMRLLAWPCAIVTLAGLASFIHVGRGSPYWGLSRALLEWLDVGMFLGIPLLAALPLGSEFQYRTLMLMLAQPIDRREIWRQKLLVTVMAVAPPAIVYSISGWLNHRFEFEVWVLAATVIVVVIGGAVFSTLIARSTMGGLALSGGFLTGPAAGWVYLANHLERHGHLPAALLWSTAAAGLGYAGAMLWLGRRMLLRFQAVEGMQAGEAFVPGARLVPRSVAELFRCRPTQPLANLVRREFRLLRALWPLSVLSVAVWIFLAVFDLVPGGPVRKSDAADVAFGLNVMGSVLIAVLAGVLSLGEEKTSGTHAWHMTLPVSASVQWLVKLGVAVFAGVLCASALPMTVLLVAGWLRGSPGLYVSGDVLWIWPLEVSAITLIAFWCACVVKGMVRATLLLFPLMVAVFFAGGVGSWLAGLLPFRFVEHVVARLDPISLNHVVARLWAMGFWPNALFWLAPAPLFAVGLIQSHRLFRAEADDTKLRVALCTAPLLAISLGCTFAVSLFMMFAGEAGHQQDALLHETHTAIEMLQPVADRETAGPQRLTVNDLAKVAPLSDQTRRWLRDSSIIVVPEASSANTNAARVLVPGGFYRVLPGAPDTTALAYSAVIRMARGGRNCSLRFAPVANPVRRYGILVGLCD